MFNRSKHLSDHFETRQLFNIQFAIDENFHDVYYDDDVNMETSINQFERLLNNSMYSALFHRI